MIEKNRVTAKAIRHATHPLSITLPVRVSFLYLIQGNKLLPWPKADGVVVVLGEEGITTNKQ